MKINTINVVEYADDNLLAIQSFPDTPEGYNEALECFKSVIKESWDVQEDEMDFFVKDEYFEQGDYQAFLTHSC